MENIDNLKKELLASINDAKDMKTLEDARINILGKKGVITDMMKNLGSLSIEE